jgi:hypothetical protein
MEIKKLPVERVGLAVGFASRLVSVARRRSPRTIAAAVGSGIVLLSVFLPDGKREKG